MWVYLTYLWKKLLHHKWYVLLECWKAGILLRGITHDLSKFYPDEFGPYARHFGRGRSADEKSDELKRAWGLHKERNPHHWEWWVLSSGTPFPMGREDRLEMLCDLRAAEKTYGQSAKEYYLQNRYKMNLHPVTRTWLEDELGIPDNRWRRGEDEQEDRSDQTTRENSFRAVKGARG